MSYACTHVQIDECLLKKKVKKKSKFPLNIICKIYESAENTKAYKIVLLVVPLTKQDKCYIINVSRWIFLKMFFIFFCNTDCSLSNQ